MNEYNPRAQARRNRRKLPRYTRMNRGYGYLCPKCRDVIMHDREEDTYFCVHKECEFKETRDEYKLTLRDIKLTLDRKRALWKAEREAERQALIAKRKELPAVVYYVRYRDTVKIGTTVDLKRRMTALPFEEVIALEQGGDALERARHIQFDNHRHLGEWFLANEELELHMKELQERNAEWVKEIYGMRPLPWDREYFIKECPNPVE